MIFIPQGDVQSAEDLEGFPQVTPGRYHVIVQTVDDSFTKSQQVIIDFAILAGTVPAMIGRRHREYLSLSEKAVKNLKRLLYVTNVISKDQLAQDLNLDMQILVGRQLVIDIAQNRYTDKNGVARENTKVPWFGWFRLGSRDVEGVPTDATVLKLHQQSGSLPAAATATSAPPANPAAVPGQDAWNDF